MSAARLSKALKIRKFFTHPNKNDELFLAFACLGTLALISAPPVVFAVAYDSHTIVAPTTARIAPGDSLQLTATVQPGCSPFGSCPPFSGILTWDDGDAGGSFQTNSCAFSSPNNLSMGTCTTIYNAPAVPGLVVIIAAYSGNGAYTPSSGGSSVQVVSPSSGATTSTTSATTPSTSGSGASSGPGYAEVAALFGVIVVAAAALGAGLALRRRKSSAPRSI